MTSMHTPSYQNAPGGRFIVCLGCLWRSGQGDATKNREQFAEHLRLTAGDDVPCPRKSPFPMLTEPQCTTGPKGHRGACTFPGTEGRTPLKVNPR